jgi:hypothetical protein
MRKVIIATVVTGLIGIGGMTAPLAAYAGGPGDTVATLDVSGGSLTIAAQATGSLTGVAAGAVSTSGQLGAVTVTDMRGAYHTDWNATATSTDFASSIEGAAVIPVANLKYSPGAVLTDPAASGTVASFNPGVASQVMSKTAGVDAFSTTDEVGINSVSWDPTIAMTVPSNAVTGSYTGTITNSVA